MTAHKKWGCPDCKQRSSRRWNMEVHIGRAHGTGEPVELEKPLHEETHSPLGSYKTNVNNGSFNRIVRGTNSPSTTRAAMNTISKSHKICPGRNIIDQYYQAALEIEENRDKIKKINEFLGQSPFSANTTNQRRTFQLSFWNPLWASNPTYGNTISEEVYYVSVCGIQHGKRLRLEKNHGGPLDRPREAGGTDLWRA